MLNKDMNYGFRLQESLRAFDRAIFPIRRFRRFRRPLQNLPSPPVGRLSVCKGNRAKQRDRSGNRTKTRLSAGGHFPKLGRFGENEYLCPQPTRTMADNYLERKMEEYRARREEKNIRRPVTTLDRLLRKNRSYRGYDATFIVRADQLRSIIDVNARIPSARNQQALRFRPVLSDEAPEVLKHIRLGGALPELRLPLPGTEPNAFIIVCSTVEENRYVDIDLGISVQSMLLRATEMGLNGICIGAFDKEAIREAFGLKPEPLLILAVGRGIEKIETTEIGEADDRTYYRRDGIHYVPKIRAEELIIK